MAVTRDKKITIYMDDSITPDLRSWLEANGDSPGGRKLLRMGYMLEQSGLADQILLLASHKGMATASHFELVAKAVELLTPLQQPEQRLISPVPKSDMAKTAALVAGVFAPGRKE